MVVSDVEYDRELCNELLSETEKDLTKLEKLYEEYGSKSGLIYTTPTPFDQIDTGLVRLRELCDYNIK